MQTSAENKVISDHCAGFSGADTVLAILRFAEFGVRFAGCPIEFRDVTVDLRFITTVFGSSPAPMALTKAGDAQQRIVFANPAFGEVTNREADWLIDRPMRHVIQSPSEPRVCKELFFEMVEGRAGRWELQRCIAGSSEFPAIAFNTPIVIEQGSVVNVFSLVDSGRSQSLLLEQRNELHAIYQQSPGFIATSKGPEHVFTFTNPSYERFVGRSNLQGRRVADALPEIIEQGLLALLDKVYQTGEPFTARDAGMDLFDPQTGKLERKYADFVYQPVRDARGVITGLFCEGYDTTAQHRIAENFANLQSELVQVSRANVMGTMAMTLAHELNQPLTAILGYSAGVKRQTAAELGLDSPIRVAIDGIDNAAWRAADIIRNLRNFTGRRDQSVSEFLLKEAVDECVRMVGAIAEPGITIDNRVDAGPTIIGDRIQVQQVLINLLRNACEAVVGCREQVVTVEATPANDRVVICVSDTGTGLSIEAAESLFTFTHSSKPEGMGVGLSISRTIVDAHGGKIWLENSDSSGSAFCFTLPMAPPPG